MGHLGVTVILAIAGVMNLASDSRWENFLVAAVAVVLAALCVVVARGATSTRAPSRRWLRGSTLASPTAAGRRIRAIRDPRSAAVAGALIVPAALSLFLTACDHQPKTAVRGAEADALKALAARADRLAGEDEFSGAVLVAKDGRVLFSHAYGLADRKRRIRNTLRTRFRIGSMNKAFGGLWRRCNSSGPMASIGLARFTGMTTAPRADRQPGRRSVRGRAARATGGVVESVTDDEIRAGIRLLAERTGAFTETAGGVTAAALAKLAEVGAIDSASASSPTSPATA